MNGNNKPVILNPATKVKAAEAFSIDQGLVHQ
jgi:hypothetical protein